MHSARVVFLMLLFTLAAVSAFAQACPPVSTCPSTGCPTITCPAVEACPAVPAPACPAACPAAVGAGPAVVTTPVCPAPVAEVPACPAPVAAQPTCPPVQFQACPGTCQREMVTAPSCAIGAGAGCGPINLLAATPAGPGFDRVYVENMYQVHDNLIALANAGAQRASDKNLRKLSEKIVAEQNDQNRKLATWYTDMGCGALPAPGACPTTDVVNCLCGVATGPQFDVVYAQTLMDTLETVRANALVGQSKLYNADIRHQAGLSAKVADNEIVALQRWMNDRGIAPNMADTGCAVPSACAAGPSTCPAGQAITTQGYVTY